MWKNKPKKWKWKSKNKKKFIGPTDDVRHKKITQHGCERINKLLHRAAAARCLDWIIIKYKCADFCGFCFFCRRFNVIKPFRRDENYYKIRQMMEKL